MAIEQVHRRVQTEMAIGKGTHKNARFKGNGKSTQMSANKTERVPKEKGN